jgi:hypothetical protein
MPHKAKRYGTERQDNTLFFLNFLRPAVSGKVQVRRKPPPPEPSAPVRAGIPRLQEIIHFLRFSVPDHAPGFPSELWVTAQPG